MTFYVIQILHITDKGTTVTRYYSDSKYESTWTEHLGNAMFFENRQDAEYTFNRWYKGEAFENIHNIHCKLKEVDISIKED